MKTSLLQKDPFHLLILLLSSRPNFIHSRGLETTSEMKGRVKIERKFSEDSQRYNVSTFYKLDLLEILNKVHILGHWDDSVHVETSTSPRTHPETLIRYINLITHPSHFYKFCPSSRIIFFITFLIMTKGTVSYTPYYFSEKIDLTSLTFHLDTLYFKFTSRERKVYSLHNKDLWDVLNFEFIKFCLKGFPPYVKTLNS